MKTRMKRKEWHSPWPDDIGKVVSEQLCEDRRHKVFIFETDKGLYMTYVYEFTDSDVVGGRSEPVGWFRVEGPSLTDCLTTAKEIAAGAVKRFSKTD